MVGGGGGSELIPIIHIIRYPQKFVLKLEQDKSV